MATDLPAHTEPTEPTEAAGSGAAVRCARPQPVGVFPLPAGFLLIPGGDETAAVRRSLAAGMLPTAWPPQLAAIELAYQGDLAGAAALLTGDDPVTRYNRFVLRPAGSAAPAEAEAEAATAEDEPLALRTALGDELGILVDVVRFAGGQRPVPPILTGESGEIAALVWSAHAAHATAAGRIGDAARMLGRAIAAAHKVAPGLAAQLMATTAGLRRDVEGPTSEVIADLAAALNTLEPTDLVAVRAELHLTLGSVHHELAGAGQASEDQAGEDLAGLRTAAEHYLAALRLITIDTAPELFASAQVSLAAAYLAMPMNSASDQLRIGVAMQGLRTALTVYTRKTHPQQWASTQLNLANALVHAPSSHRRDNLVEAVGRYQEVIANKVGLADPPAYARVLTSQGNALARLGAFPQATALLHEARTIFENSGDDESAATVRHLLDEIARHRALISSTAGS
ncbi:hypothetical protein [Parafrankia sp. EUN1f]|uniref:hypothetical protein n=1 Tax=Parafrankia sp. EUN1f TaxID=102897 RepID=UPI0001C45ADB|nr:hypothetical protein [Parafrankia sp. EUN1f]EFC81925.1 hypothetical protein FrEUN1fDRAFT_4940 [Parafrankia sp. EUN1f]